MMKSKKHLEKYPHHSLYNTKNWMLIRENHLMKHPSCFFCNSTHLLQVDHIFDHKGNLNLFNSSKNLQSLCVEHHTMKGVLDKYCSNLKIGSWTLYLDYSKTYDLDAYDLLTGNRLKSLTKLFNEQQMTTDRFVLCLGNLDLGCQKHLINLAMKKMNSKPFMIKFINIDDEWIKNEFTNYCLKPPGGG